MPRRSSACCCCRWASSMVFLSSRRSACAMCRSAMAAWCWPRCRWRPRFSAAGSRKTARRCCSGWLRSGVSWPWRCLRRGAVCGVAQWYRRWFLPRRLGATGRSGAGRFWLCPGRRPVQRDAGMGSDVLGAGAEPAGAAAAVAAVFQRGRLCRFWLGVLSLPVLLPLSLLYFNAADFAVFGAVSWAALAFLAFVNSLLGFFSWNRALALGGIQRISQLQLLQPFFTYGYSIILMGEAFDPLALLICVAVIGLVVVSKRALLKH